MPLQPESREPVSEKQYAEPTSRAYLIHLSRKRRIKRKEDEPQ